ncbi:unnamed protein product [Lactuca virosa]|uniref:Uncharacterized protein n=1 Tax=Lactuca virosa TaxID=75947 RepID=A0AAU9P778_9ASTR|nr:unnamed protein product [Lactuca virosa]
MANMTDLHLDILNVIVVMIATSSDGARDLARASAVFKNFKTQARKPHILKMVNFQRLTSTTDTLRKHRDRNGLLCMCARAGNQAAESILGKAILLRDSWFFGMIYNDNQQAYYGCIASSQVLHHHNLVRTFILSAPSKEIVVMRQYLVKYVIAHAGYNAARECGLIAAICTLCNTEAARHRATRVGSNQNQATNSSFIDILALLEPPPEAMFRDTVVILFDKLFPSARD